MKLRNYQERAVEEFFNRLEEGHKRILIQAPVGSGKTVIASRISERLNEREFRGLFIVNREVLLVQSYETFNYVGIPCSIVHNTIRRDRSGQLMVRGNSDLIVTLSGSFANVPSDFIPTFIIFDEAHKSTSATFQSIRDSYPDAIIIGLTATPGRAKNEDGERISDWYDVMVTTKTIKELIEEKFLVKPEYYNLDSNDVVVDEWLKITSNYDNKRTILFTVDTNHSCEMREAFASRGISAEIITAGDEEGTVLNQTYNQRLAIFDDFKNGKVSVLISVMALAEGFDEPSVQNVFICRGISRNNVALYHQIIGRGLRIDGTKTHCNIVDFHSNLEKFGPIEEFDWDSYEEGSTIKVMNDGETITVGQLGKRRLFVCCNKCSHVYDSKVDPVCTRCGSKNDVNVTITIETVMENVLEKINPIMYKNLLIGSKTKKENVESRVVAFKALISIVHRAKSSGRFWDFNRLYFELFDRDGNILNPGFKKIMELNKFKVEDRIVL